MNNDIYIIGEIGWEADLSTLIASVEKSDKTKPLNVHIHSGGGGVYDGLAMYNYLKNLDQEVNTFSSGLVASIASVIFLAGKRETRTINRTDNFLIHLPMGGSFGNAKDMEKTAEELREIENKISDIYVAESDITKEEAMALMEEDKFLDVDFLKEKGFVNEIVEFKAVAKLDNKKENEMTEKDQKGFIDRIEGMFAKYFPKDEPKSKIVQDGTGTEIDFTELEASATPIVGDKAMVDGKKADGDYVMSNGNTWQFENGEFKNEIVKDESEELKNQITELTNKLEEANTTIEEKNTLIASKDTDFTSLKDELTEIKASIGSKEVEPAKKEKKEQKEKNTDRKLFKD